MKKSTTQSSSEYTRKRRAEGKPKLTLARLKELLHYDPDTGKWVRKVRQGNFPAGSQPGTTSSGYRSIWIDYWPYRSSRLAWFWMTGSWPAGGNFIDHINGNRQDDRWVNLRLATALQNAWNRHDSVRSKSGHRGVYRVNDEWAASITVDSRTIFLGQYRTKKAANEARCAVEVLEWGEFSPRRAA